MKTPLTEIKELIGAGKTRTAIKKLFDVIEDNDDSAFIYGFESQFSQIKQREIKGQLSPQDVDKEFNKLNFNILDFIQGLENKATSLVSKEDKVEVFFDYNINNLVDLLSKSSKFLKKDLVDFCNTGKGFSELRMQIKRKMTKKDLAFEVVMFAENNKLVKSLIQWAESHNRKEFDRYNVISENGENVSYLDELYGILVRIKKFLPEQRKPVILFAGPMGTGKSSTINKILGKEVAKVGHTTVGTTSDAKYEFTFKDENLDFVDVPGLGENDTADESYREIYEEWASKADGFIVVINPPRPGLGKTLTTIEILLETGVNPNNIIFGLNKVGTLSYSHANKLHQVKINNLLGPKPIEVREVEKLKIQFLKDINRQIPNCNFIIDQVVAYDAVTGWNLHKLLSKVFNVLPMATATYYQKAALVASNNLKKFTQSQEERIKLEKEEQKLAEQFSKSVFNFLSNTVKKVNKKWGLKLEKKLAKPREYATKFAKSGIKFLREVVTILEGDKKDKSK